MDNQLMGRLSELIERGHPLCLSNAPSTIKSTWSFEVEDFLKDYDLELARVASYLTGIRAQGNRLNAVSNVVGYLTALQIKHSAK